MEKLATIPRLTEDEKAFALQELEKRKRIGHGWVKFRFHDGDMQGRDQFDKQQFKK